MTFHFASLANAKSLEPKRIIAIFACKLVVDFYVGRCAKTNFLIFQKRKCVMAEVFHCILKVDLQMMSCLKPHRSARWRLFLLMYQEIL